MTDQSGQTTYVLQLRKAPTLCIGVSSTAPGTQATLMPVTDPIGAGTGWCLDPNTGLIVLAVTWRYPRVLAIGGEPGNESPLVVAKYETARSDQLWNWIGTDGVIMSAGKPGFCVDNSQGIDESGNPIWLYERRESNANQIWSLVPVFAPEMSGDLVGANN